MMKYLVFALSCLFIMVILINAMTLNVTFSQLSRFGYGYFTGLACMLVLFGTTAYFSGKRIWKRLGQIEV